VSGIGLLDSVNILKVVRLGEMAVENQLPTLKKATGWPNRMRQVFFPRQVQNDSRPA
jgi:hypothetical protein